jgi:hypothetical protein
VKKRRERVGKGDIDQTEEGIKDVIILFMIYLEAWGEEECK